MTEILKNIAIKDIVANPYQPRLTFDDQELKELSDSIKVNGLIQPIIVRKSDIYGYELIAGERRLKASKIAGLTEIPAVIKDISNSESMNQAIIENLQRSDLNPIEEAKAFQNIIERNQFTHDQLAQFMGKSRPYITNSLRLLQLPKVVLEAIESHQISSGHARALLGLASQKEQEKYFFTIIDQALNVRQTEQLIKTKSKKKPPKSKQNIFIKEMEKELAKSLGTSIKISQKKDGSGHIQLQFKDESEFNRLINKLN